MAHQGAAHCVGVPRLALSIPAHGNNGRDHQAGTTGCMDSSHLGLGVEGHSAEWVPRGLGLQLLALHHRLSSHAKSWSRLVWKSTFFPYPMITSLPGIFNVSSAGFPSATPGDAHRPYSTILYADPGTKPRPRLMLPLNIESSYADPATIKHCIIILCRLSNQTKTLVEHSEQLRSH